MTDTLKIMRQSQENAAAMMRIFGQTTISNADYAYIARLNGKIAEAEWLQQCAKKGASK